MIYAPKFKTGGILDEYADFRVVECVNCKCQYIHDFEHCILYFNSNDLEQNFLTLFDDNEQIKNFPLPCRKCNHKDWDFKDIENDEIESVLNGEWGWAL